MDDLDDRIADALIAWGLIHPGSRLDASHCIATERARYARDHYQAPTGPRKEVEHG